MHVLAPTAAESSHSKGNSGKGWELRY